MRCLHCSNEVSLLQKMKDPQFCSADHRLQFYDGQQQLLLQRLQRSAERFRRYRTDAAKARNIALKEPSAGINPAAVEPKSPPYAAWLLPVPEALDRVFCLGCLREFESAEIRIIRVSSSRTFPGWQTILAPAVSEYPWPRYNSGLLSYTEFLPLQTHDQIAIPTMRWAPQSRERVMRRGRLLVRRPAGISRIFAAKAYSVEPISVELDNSLIVSAVRVPGSSAPSAIRAIPAFPLPQPEAAHRRVPSTWQIEAAPELSDGTIVLSSLQTTGELRTQGLSFLDRIFRVRPRNGVSAANAVAVQGPPVQSFEASAMAPVFSPVRLRGKKADYRPAAVDKFFRPRPKAGVDSQARQDSPASSLVPLPSQPACVLPVHAKPDTGVEPSQVSRFVRFKPKPVDSADSTLPSVALQSKTAELAASFPVLAGELSAQADLQSSGSLTHLQISTSIPGMSPSIVEPSHPGGTDVRQASMAPAVPAYSGPRGFEFAPAVSSRMFRMRPRNGVLDPSLREIQEEGSFPAVSMAAERAMPSHEPAPTGLTLPAVNRFVRLRVQATPASGEAVGPSANQPVYPQAGAPALPITTAMPLEAAPALLQKMYRGRPRGPVGTSTAAYLPVDTGDLQIANPKAAVPQYSTEASPCAPQRGSDPMQPRMRPVVSRSTDGKSTGEHQAFLTVSLKPVTIAPSAADCEPLPVSRPFRMKPRAGVSATCSPVESIAALAAEFPVRPVFVEQVITDAGDFAPPLLPRMFRMRPRTALSGETAAFMPVEVQNESCKLAPAICQMAAGSAGDFAPPALLRVFRMKPRPGVSDGASMRDVSCAPSLTHLPAVPVLDSTTPRKTESQAAPPFLNRFYRVRPRSPKQDDSTLQATIRFRHLPFEEPQAVYGLLSSQVEEPEPAMLDKLYRMRPRMGKQAAADALPIDCEPVDTMAPRTVKGLPADGVVEHDPAVWRAKSSLESLSKSWKATSSELKVMAMAVPVLAFLALGPLLSNPAVAGSIPSRGTEVGQAIDRTLRLVESDVRGRAAIELAADFQQGFAGWTGSPGWQDSWEVQPSGWAAPGALAFLESSAGLKEYSAEFTAQILSRSLTLVVGAQDEKNYYAIRIVRSSEGPSADTVIRRSLVQGGKEVARTETPLLVPVAPETILRVRLDLRGQFFTLMVQNKVVDCWTDTQLKSGGIGFMGGKSEKALVQGIRITHQNDAVGRLLAAAIVKR